MTRHYIFKGRNRVTSPYKSADRPDHGGIDIVGDDSTEVRAVYPGKVIRTQFWDGETKIGDMSYGNLVIVQGSNGSRHFYAHLASIAVSAGDNVTYGDKLGVMGSTGNSTGAHLHYEVRTGADIATRIDPTKYVACENKKGTYTEADAPVTPSAQYGTVYTVKPGDTLSAIAAKFGTTYQELAKINGVANPNVIYAGQRIRVAGAASGSTTKYYPACKYSGQSIADALKSIGVDGSYNYRAKIAAANGITGYRGTAEQNIKMLGLLRAGKLKK